MTRSAHRRRPSVWTVIALLLFIAALTLWIVVQPEESDQDNQPISPRSPISMYPVPASEA